MNPNFLHKLSIRTLGAILEDLTRYQEVNELNVDDLEQNKEEIQDTWKTIHEKSDQ